MKSGMTVLSALGTFACASLANAGLPVVYSTVTGSPTATVPNGPAFLAGAAEFTSFSRPTRSADGSRWIFQSNSTLPGTEDRVVVLMNGLTGSTVVREGMEAPWLAPGSGEILGFFVAEMGVNDNGLFAFAVNTDGTSTSTTDDYLIAFDGANFVQIARQNDPMPASISMPGELWGATRDSISVMPDGSLAYYTTASAGGSRCILGNGVVAQSTVTVPANQANGNTETFSSMTANAFGVSADGLNTIYRCNLAGDPSVNDVVVLNGSCVLHEGDAVSGLPNAIASYSRVLMMSNGDWFVRGQTAKDNEDFVIRNGSVIATTGAPIHTGSTELYDDTLNNLPFWLSQGNNAGDYVIAGSTNNPDANLDTVLVHNNTTVIAREGDPVDINNNNIDDDDRFISGFVIEGGFMTEDAVIVAVFLRDGTGAAAGSAIVNIALTPTVDCPSDISSIISGVSDGIVDVSDLVFVITNWGAVGANPADISSIVPGVPDGVVDVSDLLAVITSWGACP